ncbi:hypothetical protein [Streptococcus ferus]|uniref:hypothetical protein n=1 Tax=Streptococcus ferus TaxID=1345 RepID=UPI0035A0818F
MGKRNNRKKSSLEEQRRESQKRKSDKNFGLAKNNLGEYRVLLTNPIELKKEKLSWWSKVKSELTIIISLIAVAISLFSVYNTYKKNSYLETTNFNIIQNLWQENPNYTLYNESQKPLTLPPQPSYYMYVPAKLYYIFKDGQRYSNLILLPVSYENVISQTSTGRTIDEIETSVLPKNFYGKLGSRDLRSKTYGKLGQDGISFELRVYPFLAIATHIEYSYKDKPDEIISENFITTPWGKESLSDSRFVDLENYTRNILHFPDNEVKILGDNNVYDLVFDHLESQFDKLLPMFKQGFSSSKDRERFYALMGTRWNMEFDPSKDLSEYAEPNEDNFNSLGRELSDKVIPSKDPLYPDY